MENVTTKKMKAIYMKFFIGIHPDQQLERHADHADYKRPNRRSSISNLFLSSTLLFPNSSSQRFRLIRSSKGSKQQSYHGGTFVLGYMVELPRLSKELRMLDLHKNMELTTTH